MMTWLVRSVWIQPINILLSASLHTIAPTLDEGYQATPALEIAAGSFEKSFLQLLHR